MTNLAWKIKHIWKIIVRSRQHGIRYLWDKKYRKKIKNRYMNARVRVKYGNHYIRNRKKLRAKLYRRDGNICFWCSERITWFQATIDHRKPVSEGGGSELTNLRLIHNTCRVQRDGQIKKGVLKIAYESGE